MRWGTLLAAVAAFAALSFAQDRMTETLRKGIVEEDSSHNLRAAIGDYDAVVKQFEETRQTAATALFRMAECFRKEGKKAPAVAAYERVAKEFADEVKLARQSRAILAKTYNVTFDEPRVKQ